MSNPPESTIAQIQTILTQIRTNLTNTIQTWGKESSQYSQATQIMNEYLEENMMRLGIRREKGDLGVHVDVNNVVDNDIVGLLGSLVLDDHDHHHDLGIETGIGIHGIKDGSDNGDGGSISNGQKERTEMMID